MDKTSGNRMEETFGNILGIVFFKYGVGYIVNRMENTYGNRIKVT